MFLNEGGVVDAVLGGWQVSTTYTYRSGLPFTPVMSGSNNSNSLAGNWYPNRVGSGKLANPTVKEWFDTTAFVTPATGTFGNSRRNILYGPNFANFDVSIAKTFALSRLMRRGSCSSSWICSMLSIIQTTVSPMRA